MTETLTQAVERRDSSPAALVAQYTASFAAVLPSHIKADTWVRVAQGALRRDRNLAKAAQSDPASLLVALLEAARLGLEPGTSEFWLTPRKVRGRDSVLGIVGYRGELELIYRAGAVSSVVVEVVHTGDRFTWRPGIDDRPQHEVDWFADRGDVLGAYAYAVMKDGAVSKVVVVGPAEVARAMEASGTAGSSHSPWKTDFAAMVAKTAVHRLAKFVPTSAEFRREQLRAVAEADMVRQQMPGPTVAEVADVAPVDDAVDAEIVDEETGEIESAS